jgi:hypothetical protein
MRKERFPAQRRTKLHPRGDGPFQILEKINDNAYNNGDQGTASKDLVKYQLGRLREHEQRSSRMYSTDSSKSYGLKQIRGGPLNMIHVGNKESSP